MNITLIIHASDGTTMQSANVEAIPNHPTSAIVGWLATSFKVSPLEVVVNQDLKPGQSTDWNSAASVSEHVSELPQLSVLQLRLIYLRAVHAVSWYEMHRAGLVTSSAPRRAV